MSWIDQVLGNKLVQTLLGLVLVFALLSFLGYEFHITKELIGVTRSAQ